MTVTQISSKEKWEKAHWDLNLALEKEIHLMREILASLRQEEMSLLELEMRRWRKVMKDRASIVVQLKEQRDLRMDRTVALTKMALHLGKMEMLPHEEESSCAILSKIDQMMALMDRINLQNCRNDALFCETKQKPRKPLACAYPHPLHRPKRRTSVATYTQKP